MGRCGELWGDVGRGRTCGVYVDPIDPTHLISQHHARVPRRAPWLHLDDTVVLVEADAKPTLPPRDRQHKRLLQSRAAECDHAVARAAPLRRAHHQCSAQPASVALDALLGCERHVRPGGERVARLPLVHCGRMRAADHLCGPHPQRARSAKAMEGESYGEIWGDDAPVAETHLSLPL